MNAIAVLKSYSCYRSYLTCTMKKTKAFALSCLRNKEKFLPCLMQFFVSVGWCHIYVVQNSYLQRVLQSVPYITPMLFAWVIFDIITLIQKLSVIPWHTGITLNQKLESATIIYYGLQTNSDNKFLSMNIIYQQKGLLSCYF